MNNPFTFWRYDLFKLTVAVILLIILLYAVSPPPSIHPSVGEPDFPTLPAPVTPLDESTPPAPVDSNDSTELPVFPQSRLVLTPDDSNRNLVAPDGRIVYSLDPENASWLPVIPQDIQDKLPPGTSLVNTGQEGWAILTEQSEILFDWNGDALIWVEQQSAPPVSQSDCPVQLQPRLQAGGKARVLMNLNMRSSPGIKNNWLLTNISGTELIVLSGPVCTVQVQGTFLWWEVENPAGARGWSAEAHESGLYYYLQPVNP